MNSKQKEVSLQDLSSLLDGETSPEDAERISKALSEDPELMRTYSIYEQQMAELRLLHRPVLEEDIPERLLKLLPRDRNDGEIC